MLFSAFLWGISTDLKIVLAVVLVRACSWCTFVVDIVYFTGIQVCRCLF